MKRCRGEKGIQKSIRAIRSGRDADQASMALMEWLEEVGARSCDVAAAGVPAPTVPLSPLRASIRPGTGNIGRTGVGALRSKGLF